MGSLRKERDKDLLGRPELKGGTTGKQKEFLDKNDFLTEKERKRINAKDDLEGQGKLFKVRKEPAPVWYSKLQDVVDKKMPPKMNAEQFQNWIAKQGIKDEELMLSGLNDPALQKGKITKEDVLQTMAANNLQIEEVEKGEAVFTTDADHDRWEDLAEKSRENLLTPTEKKEYDKLSVKIRTAGIDQTKFKAYQLPGGENYRELLLRLPEQDKGIYDLVWKTNKQGLYAYFVNDKQVSGAFVQNTDEQKRIAARTIDKKTVGKVRDVLQGGHFDETNVLAHIRMNDRTDADGKKVLFIEEIQSDWHQAGRKKGYAGKGTTKLTWISPGSIAGAGEGAWETHHPSVRAGANMTGTVFDSRIFTGLKSQAPTGHPFKATFQGAKQWLKTLTEAKEWIEREAQPVYDRLEQGDAVPDAPFKKTWHELAFKRMLRYAAENGYDKLAWTTGEQQAERYDLSKKVEIEYHKEASGKYWMNITEAGTGRDVKETTVSENELEGVVGKEVAQKIIKGEGEKLPFSEAHQSLVKRGEPTGFIQKGEKWFITFSGGKDFGTYISKEDAASDAKRISERIKDKPDKILKGDDLKIGGSGMKGFYDKMLPSFANKYTKKWGGRVGETEIGLEAEDFDAQEFIEKLNDGGEWVFKSGWSVSKSDAIAGHKAYYRVHAPGVEGYGKFDTSQEALIYIEKESNTGFGVKSATVHSLDITPSMADSVMAGQPLFKVRKGTLPKGNLGKAVKEGLKIAEKLNVNVDIEVSDATIEQRTLNPKNPHHRAILKKQGFKSKEINDAEKRGEKFIAAGYTETTGAKGKQARSKVVLYDDTTPEEFRHELFGHALQDQGGLPGWKGDPEQIADYIAGQIGKGKGGEIPELTSTRIPPRRGKITTGKTPPKGMRPGKVIIPGKADLEAASDDVREGWAKFLKVSGFQRTNIVDLKHGRELTTEVVKAIHSKDLAIVEFENSKVKGFDRTLADLETFLGDKYPPEALEAVMLTRGHGLEGEARNVQKRAFAALKDYPGLKDSKIRRMIDDIADYAYNYHMERSNEDLQYREDYFLGIYKPAKGRNFSQIFKHIKSTDKFRKKKTFLTYAEAKAAGLEIRNSNPITNLKTEMGMIGQRIGLEKLRDWAMANGQGKYIDENGTGNIDLGSDIHDPVFKKYDVSPEFAQLVNALIAANKVSQTKGLKVLTEVNKFTRAIRMAFSPFHQKVIMEQSIIDSGKANSAIKGFTLGFKKNDPIFREEFYKRYIKNGGGHRYSVESDAARMIGKINQKLGKIGKNVLMPIKLPLSYTEWLFEKYIPKVKYEATKHRVAEMEEKLGRKTTDTELQNIIRAGQNLYGEQNERIFGRSGTITSLLRLFFNFPGFSEGNIKTSYDALAMWGKANGVRGNRARANVILSLIAGAITGTGLTYLITGKMKSIPKSLDDVRDLSKVDTGLVDKRGRPIMVDTLSYAKDYWDFYEKLLRGQPGKAFEHSLTRWGGSETDTLKLIDNFADIVRGKAIYDWKGDKVISVHDPFLQKILKVSIENLKDIKPFSVKAFEHAKKRDFSNLNSAIIALVGGRVTTNEENLRRNRVVNRLFDLKDDQKALYAKLDDMTDPRQGINDYNRAVKKIIDNPLVTRSMTADWSNLYIDIDRYLQNKVHTASMSTDNDTTKKAVEVLKNFDITPEQAEKMLKEYYARPKTKREYNPLESNRVIGRTRKKNRLKDRLK